MPEPSVLECSVDYPVFVPHFCGHKASLHRASASRSAVDFCVPVLAVAVRKWSTVRAHHGLLWIFRLPVFPAVVRESSTVRAHHGLLWIFG